MDEVRKIQLSYKIIKKQNIESNEKTKSINLLSSKEIKNEKNNDKNDKSKIKQKHIHMDEFKIQIQNERNEIIQQAKLKAKEIKKEAYNEGYEEGKQSGYQQGYLEGYENGIRESKSEIDNMKSQILIQLQNAQKKAIEYFDTYQEEIIRLSTEIAENITYHTIESDSQNILSLIKPILQEFREKKQIIISCNSSSIKHIKSGIEEIEKICPNASLTILEDSSLEKYDCIIENECQIVELGIKKQLDTILKNLLKIRRQQCE